MGKIIGFLIGFLFVPYFGLYGAFLGLLIGALFDLRAKRSGRGGSFFFTGDYIQDVFADSLTVFAGSLTIAGGENKETVLTFKNILMQMFAKDAAARMMKDYKKFVQNGMPSLLLEEACENILYSFDYNSKIYILTLLMTILNAKGHVSDDELFVLKNISTAIGIYADDFNAFYNSYKGQRSYSGFSRESIHEKDPYAVLEIPRDSSEEEIKKQYRTLCKKYHPDVTGNLPENRQKEMEIKMKEIINAYERIKKERGIK